MVSTVMRELRQSSVFNAISPFQTGTMAVSSFLVMFISSQLFAILMGSGDSVISIRALLLGKGVGCGLPVVKRKTATTTMHTKSMSFIQEFSSLLSYALMKDSSQKRLKCSMPESSCRWSQSSLSKLNTFSYLVRSSVCWSLRLLSWLEVSSSSLWHFQQHLLEVTTFSRSSFTSFSKLATYSRWVSLDFWAAQRFLTFWILAFYSRERVEVSILRSQDRSVGRHCVLFLRICRFFSSFSLREGCESEESTYSTMTCYFMILQLSHLATPIKRTRHHHHYTKSISDQQDIVHFYHLLEAKQEPYCCPHSC